MFVRFCIVFVLLVVPAATHAALLINEIAWMGDSESANNEWIELYNDSASPVTVDGWHLRDGMNLDIALSGTIAAGQYAVLERTDDASAPGGAFIIYTGALTNTGATLSLTRSDGTIEDQVAGGPDWQNIGGDNTTKETAQYTTSGWITAEPTPGVENATVDSGPVNSDTVLNKSSSGPLATPRKKAESEPLTLPDVDLALSIDAPEFAYVNQRVQFNVTPSGIGKTLLDSLVYTWNFGDLSQASSKEPYHAYDYPGEYVLTVHASYARHEQVAQKTITVLPVTFRLTRDAEGNILLKNNAQYEVDITGYSLYGTKSITFPLYSKILPNATIKITKEMVRPQYGLPVSLYDQAGVQVATTKESTDVVPAVVELPMVPQRQRVSQASHAPTFNFAEADVEEAELVVRRTETAPVATTSPQVAAVSETSSRIPRESLPYLGLIGLLATGIVGVYIGQQRSNH